MKYVRRAVYTLLLCLLANYLALISLPLSWPAVSAAAAPLCWVALLAAFIYINLRPLPRTAPTRRIQRLA